MPMWCDFCGRNVRTDHYSGRICCSTCGKVLSDDDLTEEAAFAKTVDGQAPITGNIVKSTQAESTESQKRASDELRYGIENMMYALGIDGGDNISGQCLRMCKCSGCTMMWCSWCGTNVRTDNNWGKMCCSLCGKVLAEDNLTEEVSFVKTADGQARITGNIVKSTKAESTESQKRALDEADYGIESELYGLRIDGGDDIFDQDLHINNA